MLPAAGNVIALPFNASMLLQAGTAGEQQPAEHIPSLGEGPAAQSEGKMTAPKI